MTKRYAIFDLDNCLADDGWRIPAIDWHLGDLDARYDAYHLLAGFDAPGNMELYLDETVRAGRSPIFLTARPIHYRVITVEWLKRRLPLVRDGDYILQMRNRADYRSSVTVKAEMVQALVHYDGIDLSQLEAAFDDRVDIVDMYCSLGINAQRLAIHETCAMTRPVVATEGAK